MSLYAQGVEKSDIGDGKSAESVSMPSFLKDSGKSANPSSRLLKDLLEAANNLPKPNNTDLGSIHLTLSELQRKSGQMQKSKENAFNNYTKAHYLLASSGVSAEDFENELNTIHVPVETFETTKSIADTSSHLSNMESYVNAKKDENIMTAIEQSLVAASRDINKYITESISVDWKARKDEIRKLFGIYDSSDKMSLNSSIASNRVSKPGGRSLTYTKSIPGNYGLLLPLPSLRVSTLKSMTREKFESYANIVYNINRARLENEFYPLALAFEDLCKSYGDLKSKQVSEAWKVVVELTDEKTNKISQEQRFLDTYQSDNPEESSQFKKELLIKSKRYLEEQFFYYVDELYMKDDEKEPFVPPSNINKISYFINKFVIKNNPRLVSKTLNVNGVPIWALIYFLLRAGLYNDAIALTDLNWDIFSKFDKNFPVYLKHFVENKCIALPLDLNERLNGEFSRQFAFVGDDIKASIDPFKYSVYKIIGKCDLSNKVLPAELNLSIEDWIWFHLSIINEFNESTYSLSNLLFERNTFSSFQKRIIQLGPKRFNSSPNNPMYLKTLILVGLNELAVQYVYEQINEHDAVHLAIGLCYYGLLKVSTRKSNDELFVLNSSNQQEINLTRLLGAYTSSFKISDPKVASQYLILIAMAKGGRREEIFVKCQSALRELVLISREFGMLLGELNHINGSKTSGILEKQRLLLGLPDIQDFHHKIIEACAIRCEEENRVFDALLLYQLCEEFDTVVALINKLLGEILSSTELDKPLIESATYENINGEYKPVNTTENNIILSVKHTIDTFHRNIFILDRISRFNMEANDLLMPVVNIRHLFCLRNWNAVVSEISKLGILPLHENDDMVEVRRYADMIHNIDESVLQVIPSLLIMVMTSIAQLNNLILSKRYQISSNENYELTKNKNLAKNCIIYAGMVDYKMPRETYSVLINLESLL